MAAVKKRWSILVLEDDPGMRENIKSNFTRVFEDSFQVDFVASICHAITRLKQQMRRGLPYDVFWIDLYLDYFSYENQAGEIVSAKSFSQIVDTERFCQDHKLTTPHPQSLVAIFDLSIAPAHKDLTRYDDDEKLQLLEGFVPYCLPEARSCFETLVELAHDFLRARGHPGEAPSKENPFAQNAVDSVFRHLVDWVSSPEKQFSLSEDGSRCEADEARPPALPSRKDKCDHSWTFFPGWVRGFYNAVAMPAKGREEHAAANPLLLELKRLAPAAYPQFLINTAFEARRSSMLDLTAVEGSEDLIVIGDDFKGERKDRALLEHVFRLCSRLRCQYLHLRSRRRGKSVFVVEKKFVEPAFISQPEVPDHTPIVVDPELGLEFTLKSFYPDFTANLQMVAEVTPENIEELKSGALADLKKSLADRQPGNIEFLRLGIPAAFLSGTASPKHFTLTVRTGSGQEIDRVLTFDQGRWLFFELACRRWFPKCFFIHSQWKPLIGGHKTRAYFLPTNQVLLRALRHAAVDHPDLFPPPESWTPSIIVLPATPSFYDSTSTYRSAFDWASFGGDQFKRFDELRCGNLDPNWRRAQQLLHLTEHVTAILKIRKLATKLFDNHSYTPSELCTALPNCKWAATKEVLGRTLTQVENARDLPSVVANDYLPGIQSYLSIILCFYTLPTDSLVKLYRFWIEKGIPKDGTRPIEKFSSISRKLDNLKFVQSLILPAQADGKNKFHYVPAAVGHRFSMIVHDSSPTQGTDFDANAAKELTALNCDEFLATIA